jgi:pimeloyl-ACP methyl ester carboxylesterase
MTDLAYTRRGRGEPLLLLHGIGSHRQDWAPVLDRLARERDVIAVDLPGHGDSPLLPLAGPTVAAGFARLLAAFLDDLGLADAHVAGNSIGGWTALDLARLGRARTVTALCPAGLWRAKTPRYCVASLWASYRLARTLGPAAPRLTATRVGRTLVLGQMVGRPWRVPAAAAAAIVHNIVATPGFRTYFPRTVPERFASGRSLAAPVTVAWGGSDRLLLPWAAHWREELPAHTRWLVLPGCGHLPMYDDPDLVAKVLLAGSGGRDDAPQAAHRLGDHRRGR